MRTVQHSPAYVAELGRAWRIVVPIRGRLSPRILPGAFERRSAALQWLASEEGQREVESARERRSVG